MTSSSFQATTGFLLSQLGVLSRRMWLDVLADHDLTPHQHAVLLTLHDVSDLTQGELARAALVDPRNMGPVLDPLESRGLIRRHQDPHDRRRRPITLTTKGRAAAERLAAATATIEAELLSPLTAPERRALQRLLSSLWESARQAPG